jgi:cytochrome c oxidase cbb3-type subunit III
MSNPDEPQDPLLLDHEADGIKELDNNLPRWWVWLFYLTIAYAFAYMGYYHILKADQFNKDGGIQLSEYKAEMATGNAIKQAAQAKFVAGLGSMEPSKDEAVLTQGKATFTTLCAPCHRPDGGGLVGPNLCDDYWMHGDKFSDNLNVIMNGVLDKGMLAWKETLKPQEIYAVASYIYTMRGSNPPNPKPREDQAPAVEVPNAFE